MSKAKVENYTPQETQEIVEAYTDCGTEITESAHDKRAQVVKDLAAKFGKSERSIRSKLVTQKDADGEKIYIARAKVSGVTGEKPEKKEVLAARLAAATPFQVRADSLEKMNKDTIQAYLTYFNAQIVDEVTPDASDEAPNENDSQEETS